MPLCGEAGLTRREKGGGRGEWAAPKIVVAGGREVRKAAYGMGNERRSRCARRWCRTS
jgi:hypothetical protein